MFMPSLPAPSTVMGMATFKPRPRRATSGYHSIGTEADLVGDGLTGAADGGEPERTVAGLEETVHVAVLPDGVAAPDSTADTISSRTVLAAARDFLSS